MMQPANIQHANKLCQCDIMKLLQKVMDIYSPYVAAYKHMSEVEKDELAKDTSVAYITTVLMPRYLLEVVLTRMY